MEDGRLLRRLPEQDVGGLHLGNGVSYCMERGFKS